MANLKTVQARIIQVGTAARKKLGDKFDTCENPLQELAKILRQPMQDKIETLEAEIEQLKEKLANVEKDMVEKKRVEKMLQTVAEEFGYSEVLSGPIPQRLRIIATLGTKEEDSSEEVNNIIQEVAEEYGCEEILEGDLSERLRALVLIGAALSEDSAEDVEEEEENEETKSTEASVEEDDDFAEPKVAAIITEDGKKQPIAYVAQMDDGVNPATEGHRVEAPQISEEVSDDLDRILNNAFDQEKQVPSLEKILSDEAEPELDEEDDFGNPGEPASPAITQGSQFLERMNRMKEGQKITEGRRILLQDGKAVFGKQTNRMFFKRK